MEIIDRVSEADVLAIQAALHRFKQIQNECNSAKNLSDKAISHFNECTRLLSEMGTSVCPLIMECKEFETEYLKNL